MGGGVGYREIQLVGFGGVGYGDGCESKRGRDMCDWISVEDRMPTLSDLPDHRAQVECIVSSERGSVTTAYWSENRYAKTERGRAAKWVKAGRVFAINVTHWMPLPEPPN